MIHLYLIRHGQSETNAKPNHIGQSATVDLTDLGVNQSEKLYVRLKNNVKFDHIYSSPYTRALHTAKIVCKDYSNIQIAHELREYSAGDWLGKSRSDIINNEVKLSMVQLGNAFLPPNGESLSIVQRRASEWLENNIIYKFANSNDSLHIGIFSHGMTIKCLLHYIMGFDQIFTWRISIDNTSISKLIFDDNGWRVITINDCAHLL